MAFEAKVKKLLAKIPIAMPDLLKLPAQLTNHDVQFVQETGTAFKNLHDFCKSTIIEACASG